MDIQACLIKLGYRAVVWGNSYDGIKPHELETRPIPPLSDLETVWPGIEAERIAGEQAEEARVAAKTRAIVDNLPSWEIVHNKFEQGRTVLATGTITVAILKGVVLGLINVTEQIARVVYWLAKNQAE